VKRALDKRSFGVEMDGYWFNARMYMTLSTELPQAKLMDGTNLVNWIRAVKSLSEIEYMRQASQICQSVMQTAVDEIDVGVWEKDVAAKVSAAQIAGTDAFGGSSPAIFPIMPSAERTSTAHLTFDPDRQYQENDVVLLELSGARYHYHAPLGPDGITWGIRRKICVKTADGVVKGLQETLTFIGNQEFQPRMWRHAGVKPLPTRVWSNPLGLVILTGLNYVPDWGEHTHQPSARR
jgi:ectoine hydrolase